MIIKSEYITFDLELNDSKKITILSYIITLTPGTIVMSVQNKRMMIHVINCIDQTKVIYEIRNKFEKNINKLW